MRSAPARIGSGRRRTGPAPRAAIDASIAVKWLVEEEGTAQALALRGAYGKLMAPDLLVPECANVLWKKTKRGEVLPQEARLMARLLSSAEIELVGTRSFLEAATQMAIELDHPAYDCMYLALAMEQDCTLVTADAGFVEKVRTKGTPRMQRSVASLSEAAGPDLRERTPPRRGRKKREGAARGR